MAILAISSAAVADNTGYVTVSNSQFILNGRPYYFAGANLWQGMNLGMADTNGGDRARLCRELDRLQSAGVNNLRIMASSEGPDSEPYRVIPSLQTAPGAYNEDVFEGLDYLLHEMDTRNMRAVMQLNNYWHWSGGMAQYVSWAEGSSIPYPPSYPDFTGSWSAFMNYSARFYANSQCQTYFQSYVSTVLSRTNTLTGVEYKEDPTIFSWELANEPRMYPQAWVDDTAAYIKSIDSNHMVTTGCEGEPWSEDFIETHNGPDIDYATCHIWPQNWGWYDPGNTSTYATALFNATNYLADHLADAEALGKPLVLDEFGLPRDRTPPLGDEYDPDSPTTFRDAFYEAIYDVIFESAKSGGAAAGDNFWAWAGEGRPQDSTPQWIGDPPHEIPGWYSVYDADGSTLAIISNHAARMTALIYDNDFDGLPDDWERLHFGALTNSSGTADEDWDTDGFIDLHEYIAGTDPVAPLEYFAIESEQWDLVGELIIVSWESVTGRLYTVTTTTTLLEGFTNVANFVDVPGTDQTMSYTNAVPGNASGFYRIKVRIER